jgi:hypothetical protein
MAGELRPYDPNQVTVSWTINGIGTIDLTQGLIDGPGAIVDTKDAPRWTRRSDRQSNAVRNKGSKRGGFLVLTYGAEAQIQDALSGYAITDDQVEAVVGLIKIKDLNGTTVAEYLGAFIEDDPSLNYGDTASDRPWVFGYAERVAVLGGAGAL